MTRATLGWDVGGAHLKLARLGADGRLEAVRIVACPLWRGLDRLDEALGELADEFDAECASAVTMTGELVDLWPDRAAGVAAIAERLGQRLKGPLAFYAGGRFVGRDAVAEAWADVASANWRATAEALAGERRNGMLVDVGSTTSDLVPFVDGAVTALGATDAARLILEELVYVGATRSPVMAIAPKVPFAGAWIAPMAEHFATSADVFRLTGDLPEDVDLHPAADGGDKTEEASARRLLRMVGADLTPAAAPLAGGLALWLAEATLRRLCDAAARILSRPSAPQDPTVYGAGVGRFLAEKLAKRLGLVYREVGRGWADDDALVDAASDCAPAVAVARLHAALR